MITAKKIKKFERLTQFSGSGNKKVQHKAARAIIMPSSKPSTFKMPEIIYITDSDVIMSVRDEKLHMEFHYLNEYKYIDRVEIHKSLGEKIITLSLQDKPDVIYTDVKLISSHLKAINQSEFGEILESFSQNYKTYIENFRALSPSFGIQDKLMFSNLSQQTFMKRNHLFSTYPCIEARLRLNEESLKISEFCMNETFLREAGYPLETFPAHALAEGIPQFFPSDSVSFIQSMKTTLEKFLKEEVSIGE